LVIESSVVLTHESCKSEQGCTSAIVPFSRLAKSELLLIQSSTRSTLKEHVSEVDPVSPIYPLSFHRRIERQWAERFKSLRRTGDQVVFAAKRTLQSATKHDGSLIPAPAGTVAERRRRDQFS
jgi:hypothetical protein